MPVSYIRVCYPLDKNIKSLFCLHNHLIYALHRPDPAGKVIEAYDVRKEKKNYGKISMGVVRTTYLIDEQGVIIKANDKVKATDDPENMLKELEG